MTVAELIEELKSIPNQDAMVCIYDSDGDKSELRLVKYYFDQDYFTAAYDHRFGDIVMLKIC